MDSSNSDLPAGKKVALECYESDLTLLAGKWPEQIQKTTILASPDAKIISLTEVKRDMVFTSRVSYFTTYFLSVPWQPQVIEVGTTLCWLILRKSDGLAGFLEDDSRETLVSDFLSCGMGNKLSQKYRHSEDDNYGSAEELPPCLQSFFTQKGTLKRAPSMAQGHWPHKEDAIFFIQKIHFNDKCTKKGLLAPVLQNLQSTVCCNPSLPHTLRITGTICWILEPGLIPGEEAAKVWAHLLEGKSEEEGTLAVVKALVAIYERIGFSCAAEKFHRAWFEDKLDWQGHTYMLRRTRATSHPSEAIEVLGPDPSGPAKKPAEEPAEDENGHMQDEGSEYEESEDDDDEDTDYDTDYEPVPTAREPECEPQSTRKSSRRSVGKQTLAFEARRRAAKKASPAHKPTPSPAATASSPDAILDEIVYASIVSELAPAGQPPAPASRSRKRKYVLDDDDDDDDYYEEEDAKPSQRRKSRTTAGASPSASPPTPLELPMKVSKPGAARTQRQTRSQGPAYVDICPEEGWKKAENALKPWN